jgi:hypothetical protein
MFFSSLTKDHVRGAKPRAFCADARSSQDLLLLVVGLVKEDAALGFAVGPSRWCGCLKVAA